MLVLTRFPGETIVIGEGENRIVVKILSSKGKKVSVGVDAPVLTSIMRGELVDAKVENKIQAEGQRVEGTRVVGRDEDGSRRSGGTSEEISAE